MTLQYSILIKNICPVQISLVIISLSSLELTFESTNTSIHMCICSIKIILELFKSSHILVVVLPLALLPLGYSTIKTNAPKALEVC